ncbi:NAD(P)H-quinone oxidoreductase [uncultured Victivallis sp.]|uniref:NAD(P)H-quinone oxidoreductase n=1 Tax=uncultured Victivallis sp. TaxID=354118 RepID=UPI0025E25FE6|nr:NAD(P)H-quinone oxidoreductase [uncultured Victivallis sp.]
MYAMKVDETGAMHWTEVPDPEAKAGEVLLGIRAAALNRADLLQRAGKYPPPPGWPEWMGLEVAGVVLAAPAGSRWKAGGEVCALLGGGGYAEKIAVPEGMVLPLPPGLSMTEAASLPEVFATAYLNLFFEANMRAGETVFVQAGASGLGLAAIQLAKSFGAKVMTSVGSPEKAEAVRLLGADWVLERHRDDPVAAFEAHPVDVALDCVGGEVLGSCIEKLAPGGRWILISTLGGEFARISLRPILKRGIRLIGSTLRSRPTEMKARILRELEEKVWPKFGSKEIRPVIHAVLPIRRAEEAHAILQRNENIGKVVLEID